MYIIIAGGGVVGRKLTRRLVKKHDVVVIDIDQEICERIYLEYGAVSVYGNATDIHVLKDAGIEKCDVVIGTMRKDTDNLAFTILAKNYGIDKILVRMRDPEYRDAYKLAGATNIGAIVDMMVDSFIIDIEQPNIRKIVSLGNGKAEVSIITLPPESTSSGKTVSEIVNSKGFPENCVIAGIYDQENDKLIIPRGNRKIFATNQVFLVATRENMEKAAKIFLK